MTNPLLLFALSPDLQLDDVLIESETLTLLLSSSRSEQACPDCASVSSRVHSRYSRRLADLPCQGRAVELCLKVRRFFCENPACSRRTSAEPFPDLAPAYARRTPRQGKTLGKIAFALGGRAGARLACFLGLPVSFWTLLRLLRRTPPPHFTTPRVLGVDDFGATRSYRCSCKDSRKEDLTWSSVSSAEPSLNQERLGQCSRVLVDGDEPVRQHHNC